MVLAIHFAARSTPPPFWIFPIIFFGVWFFVAFLVGRVSGWNTLADCYRAQQPFFGTQFRMQGAQLRYGSNYNNCLTFGSSAEGMYMVPMVLFRAFHAPLLIPWHEITATPINLWRFWNFIEIRCQRAPAIPVRIPEKLAKKLAEASAGQFRYAAAVTQKF